MSPKHDKKRLKSEDDAFQNSIGCNWRTATLREESSLHQIAPYIGKMKSSMARALISAFTREGETVCDPFSGCGTIALESWAAGRNVIANDLSPYAFVLTHAKLFPYQSVEEAMTEINTTAKKVRDLLPRIDLRRIPKWVRVFFHPETLRETVAWSNVLTSKKSYFPLSCLLGILHHQRPGFLSYPSSHTVPYLRNKNLPKEMYPELYQYRPVQERLEKKVLRALRRVPSLDRELARRCYMRDAARFAPKKAINAIITSPPYMRQLDYGRDNRLRLWLLGMEDWKSLDQRISPSESKFFALFRSCLKIWQHVLAPKGLCVLVLGDVWSRSYNLPLPGAIAHMARREVGGYSAVWEHNEPIPGVRRVRRGCRGTRTETILVLRYDRG